VLRAQRIDGFILAATGEPSTHRSNLLSSLGIPIVLVDRAMEGLGYDTIALDNRDAALVAVEHVLDLGHRRVALINGPRHLRTAVDRLQGYREALLSRGIPIDPKLIREASFRERDAYEVTMECCPRSGRRPRSSPPTTS
jgi:LacI family transcriptional regulator